LQRRRGERLGPEVEAGFAVDEVGHSGVRLGGERNGGIGGDFADDSRHRVGSGRAVAAEGVGAERLERDQRGDRVHPGQRAAARFESQRDQRGEVGELAHRDQRGAGLLQVHHGFDGKPVDAAAGKQGADLAFVDFNRRFEPEFAVGFDELACRGDVGENQLVGEGAAGEFRQFAVDLFGLRLKAELGELERVAAERRRVNKVASGGGVTALHVDDRLGMFENPGFGADPGRHSAFGQLGAGCAVEAQNAPGEKIPEFTSCHAPYLPVKQWLFYKIQRIGRKSNLFA